MRKIYCIIPFILLALQVNAQFPGQSAAGMKHLKELNKNNPEVQLLIKQQKLMADRALDTLPDPIVTISTEGKLKGDPLKIATWHSIQDFKKIYALAVVYKVYGKQEYLQKVANFLLAWAKVNLPAGNPINDTNLDGAIEGYSLIKTNLQPENEQVIRKWLNKTAKAEINSMPKNQAKETAYNNWNSHRLKIIGEIAFATADTALQKFAINALKKQLGFNLLPDGSSIDFKLRDALHYHVYDLEPLLQLAIVIKQATGENYYSYETSSGASIKKSVEWLIPYVTGEKKHGEFVNSTVKFDQDRAKNGEAGYQPGTLFNPANGLKTLALAAYFDQAAGKVVQSIKTDQSFGEDWQLLLNKLDH